MLLSPWRSAFPALAALAAEEQTYLDSAATAQKPQAMLDALAGYYASGAANVHRAQHLPGERATRAFEATRTRLAQWLDAGSPEQLVFTHGATEALNLLAYGLEPLFGEGDEIAISALEHHANLLPWQQLALRRGAKLVVLPLDDRGVIDLEAATQLIGPRTRLLAVSQLSNVLGTWQPLPELLALARAQGALSVVDGAQGVVHGRHSLSALGCDFYVFSSHKLYGPEGLGLLWAKDQDTTPIRCAVASFDARGGVLNADRIVFDTGPVLGKGSGTIDLRTERLALLTHDFDEVVAASLDTNADDEHDPEGHTIAFERSQVSALVEQVGRHLAAVDAALARVEAGTYGTCVVCGRPIGAARLEARPVAETCISCASRG